jgi:hypothetical protein
MGKPRIITASPFIEITDGVTTHYFPDTHDRRIAQFFLDKGANLLYALAVDYPGLYKIPLCYRDAARAELKRIGIKTNRPRVRGYQGHYVDGKWVNFDTGAWAMLFFLGPKAYRSSFGTNRDNATSFKIWFGSWGGLI